MISWHDLKAKSNNKTHGQFEWDLIWFCFCFDFICSHAWCGCCSLVSWRGGVHLKLVIQGKGGWENFGCRWTGGGQLDNFHGRHMRIVL